MVTVTMEIDVVDSYIHVCDTDEGECFFALLEAVMG